MKAYIQGNLTIPKPKHIASTKKVLHFKFSYGKETDSLRFFSERGTLIPDNSVLFDKFLLPAFNKRFTKLIQK